MVVHHRHVMLVMNHRRRQDFFRQRQELRREDAGDDGGPLHQIRHLVQQTRLPRRGPMDTAAETPGMDVQVARNPLAPFFTLEDDEVLEQARLVVVEGLHLHGASRSPARGEEPVPVGGGAGSHVLDERRLRAFGPADVVRDDAPAVDEQQPAHRPAEPQLALAVLEPRVPAHRLRE